MTDIKVNNSNILIGALNTKKDEVNDFSENIFRKLNLLPDFSNNKEYYLFLLLDNGKANIFLHYWKELNCGFNYETKNVSVKTVGDILSDLSYKKPEVMKAVFSLININYFLVKGMYLERTCSKDLVQIIHCVKDAESYYELFNRKMDWACKKGQLSEIMDLCEGHFRNLMIENIKTINPGLEVFPKVIINRKNHTNKFLNSEFMDNDNISFFAKRDLDIRINKNLHYRTVILFGKNGALIPNELHPVQYCINALNIEELENNLEKIDFSKEKEKKYWIEITKMLRAKIVDKKNTVNDILDPKKSASDYLKDKRDCGDLLYLSNVLKFEQMKELVFAKVEGILLRKELKAENSSKKPKIL